jgi:hypothetical protein
MNMNMNEYEHPTLNAPHRTEEIILGFIAWGDDIDGNLVVGGFEFECDD